MTNKGRKPESSNAAASRARVSSGIGQKLRQARERKNMSVRGLARYVGVSPSLVSQIERGRVMPSVGTLYSIANELGLVVDDLFTGTPSRSRTRERSEAVADITNPVLHADQRKSIRLADGVRWERLTPTPDKEVEFLLVVYEGRPHPARRQRIRLRHARPPRHQDRIRGVRARPRRLDRVRRPDATPP